MKQEQHAIPTSKKVAKNASFLTMAFSGQKILAFAYFTLVARFIGPEDVGKFVFAVSLTTIISIFIDLGLTPVLIRETAKYEERSRSYLNSIISFKILMSVVAYGVAASLPFILGKDMLTTTMVLISGLVMIADSFALSFWGIFRGMQNLRYESISIIINQIFILLVGLGGIYLGFPVYVLVLGLLAGSLFSLIFSAVLLKKKTKHRFSFTLKDIELKKLLWLALPFALAGIFTRVYSYIDQVLLSVLIGDTQLGWYSVAYKITFALQFLPSAFAASMYPAMSNYYEHAKEKLVAIFEKSMYLLFIIAAPIAVGTIVIARPLIEIVYTTSYTESVIPLQILIVALPAIFLAFPVGAMLNSCDRQHINTINLGITMVINVVLNIVLIPLYAHVGAAFAATVSLYYLFIANLFFVGGIITYNKKFLLSNALRTVLASGGMGYAVYFTLAHTNILYAILAGVVVYPALLLALKTVTKKDVIFIRSMLRKS